MQRFTVSRDDRYHEAWPSICLAANGTLVCCYAEADRHGGGAVPSAVVRISDDEGVTWSEPIVVDTLMDRPASGYFHVPFDHQAARRHAAAGGGLEQDRIHLRAGGTLVRASRPAVELDLRPGQRPAERSLAVRSSDHGRTWSGPERTGCLTTSLNLKQIGDGTLFLSGGHFRTAGEYEAQVLYRSEDAGRTGRMRSRWWMTATFSAPRATWWSCPTAPW